jgi:hypothetical protein
MVLSCALLSSQHEWRRVVLPGWVCVVCCQLYNKAFGGDIPAAMVLPTTSADVVTALNIVLSFNETIAVRSASGHSYIAQSTYSNGLVLCLEVGVHVGGRVGGRFVGGGGGGRGTRKRTAGARR